MKKKKQKKSRSGIARSAWSRTGAGPHRDKKKAAIRKKSRSKVKIDEE